MILIWFTTGHLLQIMKEAIYLDMALCIFVPVLVVLLVVKVVLINLTSLLKLLRWRWNTVQPYNQGLCKFAIGELKFLANITFLVVAKSVLFQYCVFGATPMTVLFDIFTLTEEKETKIYTTLLCSIKRYTLLYFFCNLRILWYLDFYLFKPGVWKQT